MVMVLISHFGFAYFRAADTSHLRYLFIRIGMVASPTFMIVSGLTLGVLHQGAPERTGALSSKLFDRGLFLLTVAHALIGVTYVDLTPEGSSPHMWFFITDTIGVCLLVGPTLVRRLSGWERIGVSLALYVFSWFMVIAVNPGGPTGQLVKEVLVGATQLEAVNSVFPVLPWFALYLVSTVLGERIAEGLRKDRRRVARGLGLGGAVALMSAHALNRTVLFLTDEGSWVRHLASSHMKNPPSPVYFLFFGGVGLLILSACLMAQGRSRLWTFPMTLGRASLFVFVAQYYLFYSVIMPLPAPADVRVWPLALVASIGLMYLGAWVWDARSWNRWLTVVRPLRALLS